MSREMVNSGIPWIGEIPKDWTVCFIKQIMRNKSIKGYPNETVLSLYRDYGIVPKDSRNDNHNVTSEDTSNYKFVEVGDFVINKMKAWQGSMAVSEYQGIISPAYYICRFTSPDIERRYIHYLLRNDTYKNEYMRLSSGMRVGQWDLNIDDFLRIKMILPSLSEQQKIASFLDRKCSEIDEMIALQEKIIEELKAYKQSVITEAVTKGLNPDVPMKDSEIEWVGEIPKHWEIRRLKDCGYLYGGLSGKAGDDFNVDEERDNYAFFIPFTNIWNNLYIDENNLYRVKVEPNENQNEVAKGDLLFLMSSEDYSGLGKTSLLNTSIKQLYLNSFCKGFRVTDRSVDSRYLNFLLTSSPIRNIIMCMGNGFIRVNLRAEKLSKCPIILPTICEQTSIADYLDTKCIEIDNLISIKRTKIEDLKEYKKSIIYEYVTGKKEVTE